MASTITTGSKIVVAGDFAKMVIVDRLRLGLTVQFSPVLLDQATGRPNGSSGWFAFWRVSSGLTDVSQFRTLVAQ